MKQSLILLMCFIGLNTMGQDKVNRFDTMVPVEHVWELRSNMPIIGWSEGIVGSGLISDTLLPISFES